MNFVAHVAAASLQGDDPDLLLGAALPDLVPARRLDLEGSPVAIGAGVDHHRRADAAFHDDERFRTVVAALRHALGAAGVGRGAARATAHAGVELLLDGALLADGATSTLFAGVWERLRRPDAVALEVVAAPDRPGWAQRLDRLTTHLDPWAHNGPAAVATRLEHVLAGRPLLALGEGDRARVADVLGTFVEPVGAMAAPLVADVAVAARQPS